MTTVLHITARADIGGGPSSLNLLLKHLPAEINSFVAAPRDEPFWGRFSDLLGTDKLFEIPHRKFTMSALIHLAAFIQNNNIQIVHSHGKGAGIYSRMVRFFTGAKVIHTFHGIHTADGLVNRRLYPLVERGLKHLTHYHIATSPSEAEIALHYGFCSKSSLRLIANGVEIPDKVVNPNAEFNFPLRILHISRFDGAKNSELCLEIWRELKNLGRSDAFQLHFIGDGPGRQRLQSAFISAGFGDTVFFHGFKDDVRPFYLTAFCCLSTSRGEGMPLALMEAASFGLPVIASRVTGNRDVVKDGVTGRLFDLSSPREAAEYLITMADTPALWSAMSQSAVEWSRLSFTIDRTAQSYCDLYQLLTKK